MAEFGWTRDQEVGLEATSAFNYCSLSIPTVWEKMNHQMAALVHNAKSFYPNIDVLSTCNCVCLVGHGLFVAVFLSVVIEEEI